MLSVAHPLMLAGVAAAALPVVIHLMGRGRSTPTDLPTTRFLLEAAAGVMRRQRLRDRLLLALRIAAVALLAVLVARPQWTSPAMAAHHTPLVVVLDVSASLSATQRGVPLLDQAKAAATAHLAALPAGAAAGVVFAGAQAEAALPVLSDDHARLAEAVQRHAGTAGRADASAALLRATALLDGVGRVVVITDGQRSNWQGVAAEVAAGVRLALETVGTPSPANAGVIDVAVAPAEPVAGETVRVTGRVFNASDAERALAVSLQWAGIARQTIVTTPPWGEAVASFDVLAPAAGWDAVRVSLPGDALTVDDGRSAPVRVRERRVGAVVTDDPAARFYLATALRAAGWDVREAAAGADVVVREQDGVWQLSNATEPVRLASPGAMVEAGAGDVVRPAADLPAPVVWLDELDQAGLASLTPRTWRTWSLPTTSAARVVLWHADGGPAVSLAPGRSAVANLALVPPVTRSPLLAPLVASLAEAVRPRSPTLAVDAVEPMVWPADRGSGDAPPGVYRLIGPGGLVATRVVSGDAGVVVMSDPLVEPGVYRLERGGAVVALVSANAPAVETDLRRTRPFVDDRPVQPTHRAAVVPPLELWPGVLAGLAGVLAIETAMSARRRGGS